jgi:flagellar protein FliO/FliZ
MLFNVIITFAVIVILIYVTLRLGNSKIKSLQNGRFMKILDRVQLSKESSMVVMKIGNDGYIVSVSSSKVEIIKKLTEEELKLASVERETIEFKNIKETYSLLKEKGKTFYDKNKKV